MSYQEQQVLVKVVAWVNLGYSREECIRFLKSEGYSESFAVEMTDKAFTLLYENSE